MESKEELDHIINLLEYGNTELRSLGLSLFKNTEFYKRNKNTNSVRIMGITESYTIDGVLNTIEWWINTGSKDSYINTAANVWCNRLVSGIKHIKELEEIAEGLSKEYEIRI